MKVQDLEFKGVKLVEMDVHSDERGYFVERFHQQRFQEAELPTKFIQDNFSHSKAGVLRGFHYQMNPSQGKLVCCLRGKILDVAVDLRRNSKTFGKALSVELSPETGRMLWIPAGFAHGFCVLGPESADVWYKVDAPYYQPGDRGLRWDDPTIAFSWPIKNPVLSKKDQSLPTFKEILDQGQLPES